MKREDILVKDILLNLEDIVPSLVGVLESDNLPFIHFTTEYIELEDGTKQPTGFVENICKNGFRARDTNVGGFTDKHGNFDAFNSVEDFVKSFYRIMNRYLHHGKRTNKAILKEYRDSGIGRPAMILISGQVKVERGSDYDNHFILSNGARVTDILEVIPLTYHKANSVEDIADALRLVILSLQKLEVCNKLSA